FDALQLAALDRVGERGRVAPLRHLAAHGRTVAVHRRKVLAEFETLALLAARPVAGPPEHATRPGALQRGGRRPAVEDRRHTLLEEGHAQLLAALAFEEALL